LKKIGILHETPESASAKVSEVWHNVAGWWHQKEVQEARIYFCNRFARISENPLPVLKEALTMLPLDMK
jgi:putative transferase (TIGR04331 family)